MAIFEIYGKTENGKLSFETPYHRFSSKEKIALRKIIIEWSSPREKVFGIVQSDLVDLCSKNTKQQIFAFTKPPGTSITDITINDPVFYDIEHHDLEDVTFDIKSMFEKPIPEIKHIYFQLLSNTFICNCV